MNEYYKVLESGNAAAAHEVMPLCMARTLKSRKRILITYHTPNRELQEAISAHVVYQDRTTTRAAGPQPRGPIIRRIKETSEHHEDLDL